MSSNHDRIRSLLLPMMIFSATITEMGVRSSYGMDLGGLKDIPEADYEARLDAIRAEIYKRENHPWAGEYYCGDGLGSNLSLAVAPGAGFAFQRHGCLGVYRRDYGWVSTSDDSVLRLTWSIPDILQILHGSPPEFIPVRWGDRRYLIQADAIGSFCHSIYAPFGEPRDGLYGRYYLHVADVAAPVTGLPELPERYKGYLPDEPIYGFITNVIESNQASESRGNVANDSTSVEISVGADCGVLEGMVFEVCSSDSFLPLMLRVVTVFERSSLAVALWSNTGSGPPQIGWDVATGVGRARCHDWFPKSLFQRSKFESSMNEAKAREKFIVALFCNSRAPVCGIMNERLRRNKGVQDWVAANAVCCRINADERQDLIDAYAVRRYPTLLFLRANGEELDRAEGYVDATAFVAMAQKVGNAKRD